MAEDFAEAFRRYWLIITTVTALVGMGLITGGNLYVSLRDEIASLRSDLRDYGTERVGLLRDIEGRDALLAGRMAELEKRLERLEVP